MVPAALLLRRDIMSTDFGKLQNACRPNMIMSEAHAINV